jgi:predicted transcriptional regulator
MPNIEKALKAVGKRPAYAKVVDYLAKDHDWHTSLQIEHDVWCRQPEVSNVMSDLADYVESRQKPVSEQTKGRPIKEYRLSEEAEQKLFTNIKEEIEREYKEKMGALGGI